MCYLVVFSNTPPGNTVEMGQRIHVFSSLLALQQIVCFICPRFQELLSWLLQPFCSASGSLGSIVQQRWFEMNGDYHCRKQNCHGCRLGKRGCQMGNEHWGWGRETEEKGDFCLYWHVAGSLHACVILTSFSLQHGSLRHPDPRKYKQMSPGRPSPLLLPTASTSFTHRVLYLKWLFFFIIYVFQLSQTLFPLFSLQLHLRGRERMDLMHLPVELGAIDNHLKVKFLQIFVYSFGVVGVMHQSTGIQELPWKWMVAVLVLLIFGKQSIYSGSHIWI